MGYAIGIEVQTNHSNLQNLVGARLEPTGLYIDDRKTPRGAGVLRR